MKNSKIESPFFSEHEMAKLPLDVFLSRVLPDETSTIICPGLPKSLSSIFGSRRVATSADGPVSGSFVFAHKNLDDGTLAAMLSHTQQGGVVGFIDQPSGWQSFFKTDSAFAVEARCEGLLALGLCRIRVLETTGEHALRWVFGQVR